MEIIAAAGAMLCFVSSWIISHFGRNPVRGGRPARESRVSRSAAFRAGVFVQEVIRVDSFRALVEWKVRNTAAVISVYR